MNGKFFDVKKTKQDAIINAALKIFALNGYKNASTDVIVKEAGISKGLLFHYFESKKGLYEFIYDYSVKYMKLELTRAVSRTEKDFFVVQIQVARAKTKVLKNYPYMEQFINNSRLEKDPDALAAIVDVRDVMKETYNNIYSQTDNTRFMDRLNIGEVIDMINWMSDGFFRDRFRNPNFDLDEMNDEFERLLNLLRRHFYKNPGNDLESIARKEMIERNDDVMEQFRLKTNFQDRIKAGRNGIFEDEDQKDSLNGEIENEITKNENHKPDILESSSEKSNTVKPQAEIINIENLNDENTENLNIEKTIIKNTENSNTEKTIIKSIENQNIDKSNLGKTDIKESELKESSIPESELKESKDTKINGEATDDKIFAGATVSKDVELDFKEITFDISKEDTLEDTAKQTLAENGNGISSQALNNLEMSDDLEYADNGVLNTIPGLMNNTQISMPEPMYVSNIAENAPDEDKITKDIESEGGILPGTEDKPNAELYDDQEMYASSETHANTETRANLGMYVNSEMYANQEMYANPGIYVDANGNYVDANGNYVDANGQYVDMNGQYMDMNSQYMGNQFIGVNGQYYNPDNAYMDNGMYAVPNEAYNGNNEAYTGNNETYMENNASYMDGNETYVNRPGVYVDPSYYDQDQAYNQGIYTDNYTNNPEMDASTPSFNIPSDVLHSTLEDEEKKDDMKVSGTKEKKSWVPRLVRQIRL